MAAKKAAESKVPRYRVAKGCTVTTLRGDRHAGMTVQPSDFPDPKVLGDLIESKHITAG